MRNILIGLLLASFIVIGFYAAKVSSLNRQISSLQAHGDTLYVEGKPDTVFVEKPNHGHFKPEIKKDSLAIDTVLINDEIIISVYSENLKTKPIEIEYSFTCKEKIIKQVDTVFVPKPYPVVEVHKEGYLVGALIGAGGILLIEFIRSL